MNPFICFEKLIYFFLTDAAYLGDGDNGISMATAWDGIRCHCVGGFDWLRKFEEGQIRPHFEFDCFLINLRQSTGNAEMVKIFIENHRILRLIPFFTEEKISSDMNGFSEKSNMIHFHFYIIQTFKPRWRQQNSCRMRSTCQLRHWLLWLSIEMNNSKVLNRSKMSHISMFTRQRTKIYIYHKIGRKSEFGNVFCEFKFSAVQLCQSAF